MTDTRLEKLAQGLINYSCQLKKGEKILIEVTGQHFEIANLLVREAYKAGGQPFVRLRETSVTRAVVMQADEALLNAMADDDAALMEKMDAYIGLRGGDNSSEMSDVPQEKMNLYMKHYTHRVHGQIRVPDTKWVVLRYPSPSMAQLADMSTESFEDFYFNVCNLDYSKMGKAMLALKSYMEKTDRVRLVGPGTDLTFSIKDIPVVPCDGKLNIPDGEVFTAPVRDSVNGKITFNTPSLYQSFTFQNISFTFRDGKIVEASGNDTERLNKILDTDEGARYVGEFAIGVNPYITKPMKDTLFDEKIAGSIHFTPGKAYDEAWNGNASAIHWDLVLIQRPEYGGGEIYFDDKLVRKDGLFVVDELKCLNPESLK